MYFYRICNRSNCFLTAETANFSRTVHILLYVISSSQVETIVQIFVHVEVELYATLKVRKTELFLTMLHPRADPLWEMPHRWEGEVKKCPTNARRGMGVLRIDRAIMHVELI